MKLISTPFTDQVIDGVGLALMELSRVKRDKRKISIFIEQGSFTAPKTKST